MQGLSLLLGLVDCCLIAIALFALRGARLISYVEPKAGISVSTSVANE